MTSSYATSSSFIFFWPDRATFPIQLDKSFLVKKRGSAANCSNQICSYTLGRLSGLKLLLLHFFLDLNPTQGGEGGYLGRQGVHRF